MMDELPIQGSREIDIDAAGVKLEAMLSVPDDAAGMVVFAHGSGSSRFSPRNRMVAQYLRGLGLGTLLFDLLTQKESFIDEQTRELRFNVPMLSRRLSGAVDWVQQQDSLAHLGLGLFGASTGAAAALIAAAERPEAVCSVVSRGGRPDLAGDHLSRVRAPTLLIVGGYDSTVIDLNRQASRRLTCEHKIELVAGATHLFDEPGALEQVARLAGNWFLQYFEPQMDTDIHR